MVYPCCPCCSEYYDIDQNRSLIMKAPKNIKASRSCPNPVGQILDSEATSMQQPNFCSVEELILSQLGQSTRGLRRGWCENKQAPCYGGCAKQFRVSKVWVVDTLLDLQDSGLGSRSSHNQSEKQTTTTRESGLLVKWI